MIIENQQKGDYSKPTKISEATNSSNSIQNYKIEILYFKNTTLKIVAENQKKMLNFMFLSVQINKKLDLRNQNSTGQQKNY